MGRQTLSSRVSKALQHKQRLAERRQKCMERLSLP